MTFCSRESPPVEMEMLFSSWLMRMLSLSRMISNDSNSGTLGITCCAGSFDVDCYHYVLRLLCIRIFDGGNINRSIQYRRVAVEVGEGQLQSTTRKRPYIVDNIVKGAKGVEKTHYKIFYRDTRFRIFE